MLNLSIDPEKVERIIWGARAFDTKEAESDPDSGSNGADDAMVDILEDTEEDSIGEQLAEVIRGLDEDEQVDLVALAWVGRGTYSIAEWDEARQQASEAHNGRTAEYLLSLPMLGDYLEEGLCALLETESEEESSV